MTPGAQGSMFTPPSEPRRFQGTVWGPASSYWFAVAAWLVIVGGVLRSSPPAGAAVFVLGLLVFGGTAYFATGTAITVGAGELVVTRRWRAPWRVSAADFLRVVENIPQRPRAPSMAGWTFHATEDRRVSIELAMFSPPDRARLRKLFAPVLVDADAGMPRR